MRKPLIQRCLELLSRVSLRAQYRLGDVLALLLRAIPNEISRQTRQNIDLCFAARDAATRNALFHASTRHTCYALCELAAVWCWPSDKILARIREQQICDEFSRSDRGRIILAPHLGSWETLVIWLGQHHEAIVLYKRPKNRAIDRFIKHARERSGGHLVPTKKGGLRKLLIGLKQGANLMILPDQKPRVNKARIESSFFGIDAPTTTLVHSLCSKVECDVFIATIYRSMPPGEFGLTIEHLDYARLAADDVGSAQYMNDQIERLARQHAAQYQWGYRRFESSTYASTN